MKIALTGAAGKLGSTVLSYLRDAGHEVTGMDVAIKRAPGNLRVDLSNYGDVVDALFGARDVGPVEPYDAIVHLAAIPAPGIVSDASTFHNNINATFNVFQAARRLGIKNIV